MPLSNELVSDFVKLVKSNEKKPTEETLYGTAVQYNDQIYVRLDGSDRITPVNITTNVRVGDRVMVLLKNHTATVTGNLTSPSASNSDVKEVDEKASNAQSRVDTIVGRNLLRHSNTLSYNKYSFAENLIGEYILDENGVRILDENGKYLIFKEES